MNKERQNKGRTAFRVPTQFGPEVEFELTPVAQAQARQKVQTEFAALQERLLTASLRSLASGRLRASMRSAATEAAAIAWSTPYPLLVMPLLFEEKAGAARSRTRRQRQIRARSEILVSSVF